MESEGSLHIHNSKLLVPMLRQINPSPQPHTLIPILILSSRMTQYAGKIMNELTATYRNFMNISLPSSFLPLWAYKWVTIGFELVLICTWYENAMGWHTAVLQSLAHSCYYNSWHTAVLQFLTEVNRRAFDSQEVETSHCFFNQRMCHVILVCTYRMG